MLYKISLLVLCLGAVACNSATNVATQQTIEPADSSIVWDGQKIQKTAAEWKQQLTANQYDVLRNKATERAFTGHLYDKKDKGLYCCAACGLPLFTSKTKFDSGTGWASFYAPIATKNVGELADHSHGMTRTEVVCNRCDGHLGHVFEHATPTGLRYCINDVSLNFVPAK